MGKVQEAFGNGLPGAVSRSIDDIIISVRNASDTEIPFGTAVFMTANGAVPFNPASPQDFTTFLGFAVRVEDKTPDTYLISQYNDPPEGTWHPGDVMEVLTRGGIAVKTVNNGQTGGKLYVRKSDGKLTTDAGASGTTVLLENVRIRRARNSLGPCCEVVVSKRNIF